MFSKETRIFIQNQVRIVAKRVLTNCFKGFLHRKTFAQNTEKLLHTEVLHTESLYTEKHLHREVFTHSKLLHTQKLYTQPAFTQRSPFTEKHLHREAFTQRRFYTQQAFKLRKSADKSLSHTAAAPSNLDAAIIITMLSAETELQNTIELRATASEIAAPKPDLDKAQKKI